MILAVYSCNATLFLAASFSCILRNCPIGVWTYLIRDSLGSQLSSKWKLDWFSRCCVSLQ